MFEPTSSENNGKPSNPIDTKENKKRSIKSSVFVTELDQDDASPPLLSQKKISDEEDTDQAPVHTDKKQRPKNSAKPSGFLTDLNHDDAKTPSFFEKVLKDFAVQQPDSKLAFITVNHVVSTLPHYISALKQVGRIITIIPKSSFVDDRVKKYILNQGYDLSKITKENIQENPQAIVEFIKQNLNEMEKLVIIDIGGYFAPCVDIFSQDAWCKERIIGIVEDTENGHQKYEKILGKNTLPVVSVARSQLKNTEDYNVGKSIVRAADTLLRTDACTTSERMKVVVVLGFGKIGRSIAIHLRQIGIQEIIIVDILDNLLMEAVAQGFKICKHTERDACLIRADMIFSATGRRALTGDDFTKLKNHVFIASVTSADDEMDLAWLKTNAQIETVKETIRYRLGSKIINLLSDGNAVNFVYGAINGPYIYSVQAELIVCAVKISRNQYPVETHLQIISQDDMQKIAAIWLETYEPSKLDLPTDTLVKTQQKSIFTLPTFSHYFIGRRDFLDAFNRNNQKDKSQPVIPTVIAGMGGVGKTEFVLKHGWENREHYTNCVFVSGESVQEDLQALATTIGLVKLDTPASIEEIYAALKLSGRTLIIFDDVDSYENLKPYLCPDKKGYSKVDFSIIVTSRNQHGWSGCEVLTLDPDDDALKQDAINYVKREINCDAASAKQLAEALQYHALALSQAIGYIKLHSSCDITQYLQLLEENANPLLSSLSQETRETKIKRAVSTTWNISLQALGTTNQIALTIVKICSFLFPDAIQKHFFASLQNKDTYLLSLLQFSLIYNVDSSTFKIHRLLQEVIREQLKKENKLSYIKQLLILLAEFTTYQREALDCVIAAEKHMKTVQDHMRKNDIAEITLEVIKYPTLLYHVALYYLDHLYENQQAFELLSKAKQFILRQTPVDSVLLVKIKRQYAVACMRLGKFEQAEVIILELLSDTSIDPKFLLKIKLDKFNLLRSMSKFDDAKVLLDDILRECGSDLEIKARCFHYLGKLYTARVQGIMKTIQCIRDEIKELEIWKTSIIKSKNERISSLTDEVETLVTLALENYEKSFQINNDVTNDREMARTVLAITNLLDKNSKPNMIERIIRAVMQLFDGPLQRMNPKQFQKDFCNVTIALAKLYSNYCPVFKTIGKEDQAKLILDSEIKRFENEYGKESLQYKSLSNFMRFRQTSLSTDLFRPRAAKPPATVTVPSHPQQPNGDSQSMELSPSGSHYLH